MVPWLKYLARRAVQGLPDGRGKDMMSMAFLGGGGLQARIYNKIDFTVR